jgi:hypothetical protein
VPRPQTSRDTVEDLPATRHHHRRSRPSADVALLAATALGFAYAPTGNDQTHARRLATLAGPHPDALSRAQAAVLALEIGSAPARTRAATLLRSAARLVADPHVAVLDTEAAALADVPLTAAVEGQR